jgi:4-hydroxy-2-oxoheptanedioate aldolase
VRRTIAACRRHGKIAGFGGVYREDALRLYAGLGIRLMLAGNDLALLLGALRQRADFVAGLAAVSMVSDPPGLTPQGGG